MRRKGIKGRLTCAVLAIALGISLTTPTAFAKVTKQESVYVIAEPDGTTKSITVSDQLQGAADMTGTLKDVSELTDIKNVKGDETFEQNGKDITWNLNGADIYYQGKTEKQLPVSVKISYEFEGKEVNPKDIIGQSGKLKIHLSYVNNSISKKTINGESVDIATPFVMATGFILSGDNFSKVKIEGSGKVIDDGSKSIVVFIGFPGIKDSLNLSKKIADKLGDKLNPEFTIECETTEFEMKNTFTFASANLMNSLMDNGSGDTAIDLSKIDDKIDQMTSAVKKLDKGAGSLKDGVKKVKDGIGTLKDSIVKYANEGVKKLTSGIRELTGKVPALKSGVNKYINGVDTFASGTKAYVEGAGKITGGITKMNDALSAIDANMIKKLTDGLDAFAQGISAATDKDSLKKLSDGANAVSDGIGTVNSGINKVKDSFSNNDAAITGLETALAANEQVLAGLKTAKAAGAQGLDQAIATLEQTTEGEKRAITGLKTATAAQKLALAAVEDATSKEGKLGAGAAAVAGGVTKLTDGLGSLSNSANVAILKLGLSTMAAKLPELISGVKQLKAGGDKLSANDKKLISGAKALQKANKTMRSTMKKLTGGIAKLGEGAGKLDTATDQVVGGVDKLKNGADKLYDGAAKLSDGLSQFRKKAINKILDFYNDDIKTLIDRAREIVDAGKEYNSFSGIDSAMDGEVKFIIETEAVKADEE